MYRNISAIWLWKQISDAVTTIIHIFSNTYMEELESGFIKSYQYTDVIVKKIWQYKTIM